MNIDEPRRDTAACGLDSLFRGNRGKIADIDYSITTDSNIRETSLCTRPVDQLTASNLQIKHVDNNEEARMVGRKKRKEVPPQKPSDQNGL